MNKLKKVIILSYFFPPANFTGSQRPYDWAINLSKFGWYPIIVTRQWPEITTNISDNHKDCGTETIIEKYDNYEIHRLPYKSNLRDKLFVKAGSSKNKIFALLSKVLTLQNLILRNYFVKSIPFHNLYSYTKTLISNRNIKYLIATAAPYELFFFAYKLKKEFNDLKWIADYRDEWTTDLLYDKNWFYKYVLKIIEKSKEKKWVSTSSMHFCVSPLLTKKIDNLLGKQGTVLYNGFGEDINIEIKYLKQEDFTVVFGGSIYINQPIDIFLSVFEKFIEKYKIENFRIVFLGTNQDNFFLNKIKIFKNKYPDKLELKKRIPKIEAVTFQKASSLLFMLPFEGMPGCPSSKIFDYLAFRRPILLYPSDNDIIEKTLQDCGYTMYTSNEEEAIKFLKMAYDNFVEENRNEKYNQFGNVESISKYSRLNQTQKLAHILDIIE